MAIEGARQYGLTDDQLRAMPTVYRPDLFKGKTVVVTGAGSGFGFAIATSVRPPWRRRRHSGAQRGPAGQSPSLLREFRREGLRGGLQYPRSRTLHSLYRQRLARARRPRRAHQQCRRPVPADGARLQAERLDRGHRQQSQRHLVHDAGRRQSVGRAQHRPARSST